MKVHVMGHISENELWTGYYTLRYNQTLNMTNNMVKGTLLIKPNTN